MRRPGRQHGFTLLELLISISMVGIIVLIITGAVSVSRRAVASGEKKIDQMERIRATISILDSQVQSSLQITVGEEAAEVDETTQQFEGKRDMLRMATNHSIWKGQGGYVVVTYRISTDAGGKKALSAAEQTVGVENTRETELLRGFDDMFFSFFGVDPAEEEGGWRDEWSDELLLPEKVMLTLKKGENTMNLVMPLRARGTEDLAE